MEVGGPHPASGSPASRPPAVHVPGGRRFPPGPARCRPRNGLCCSSAGQAGEMPHGQPRGVGVDRGLLVGLDGVAVRWACAKWLATTRHPVQRRTAASTSAWAACACRSRRSDGGASWPPPAGAVAGGSASRRSCVVQQTRRHQFSVSNVVKIGGVGSGHRAKQLKVTGAPTTAVASTHRHTSGRACNPREQEPTAPPAPTGSSSVACIPVTTCRCRTDPVAALADRGRWASDKVRAETLRSMRRNAHWSAASTPKSLSASRLEPITARPVITTSTCPSRARAVKPSKLHGRRVNQCTSSAMTR